MNFTNIRPYKIKEIPWGWTTIRTPNGVYCIDQPGFISMPKKFNSYFDWNRYEIRFGDSGKPSKDSWATMDHKSIFTTAARFMGLEKLITTLPNLDPIVETYSNWNRELLYFWGHKINHFIVGDDICWKVGPFVNPVILRKWYFPQIQKLVNLTINHNIKNIWFHSDGDLSEVINDIEDLGVTGIIAEEQTSLTDDYNHLEWSIHTPSTIPQDYKVWEDTEK
ncbi:MAG: hypothetical protein ABID54_13315 [Pseudomonadota bacterium]